MSPAFVLGAVCVFLGFYLIAWRVARRLLFPPGVISIDPVRALLTTALFALGLLVVAALVSWLVIRAR